MAITKASARFMKNDIRKKLVSLCLSENRIIHIMHHFHDRSVCGDIGSNSSCLLIKRLAIRDILDYWIEKVESIKQTNAISSVWDNIDNVQSESDFFESFDDLIREMTDAGFFDEAILESNTINKRALRSAKFCSKCMGIFLAGLFSDKKDTVQELLKKYI